MIKSSTLVESIPHLIKSSTLEESIPYLIKSSTLEESIRLAGPHFLLAAVSGLALVTDLLYFNKSQKKQ